MDKLTLGKLQMIIDRAKKKGMDMKTEVVLYDADEYDNELDAIKDGYSFDQIKSANLNGSMDLLSNNYETVKPVVYIGVV